MYKSIYIPLILLAACGSKAPKASVSPGSTAGDNAAYILTAPNIKHADIGHYFIAIQSRKNGQASVLFVYDRTSHRLDSLVLDEVEADSTYTHITNMTRAVGFDKLALIIDWKGDSDHMYSDLVGYMEDTLKLIYQDPNPGGIKDLKRKDESTLIGLSYGQDELTGDYNILCPMTISLKTLEGEIKQPDTAVVLFDTEAKEPILAHRISHGNADYMIAPGTAFRIDTIFNVSQTATLHIGDSIVLRTEVEQLQLKIKVSGAG